MEYENVLRTRINDDVEICIDLDSKEVTMSNGNNALVLSEDDAYKVFRTLESVLFSNVPIVESLALE